MSGRDVATLLESCMGRENVALLRRLGVLAENSGTSAYVVGGVVRDALLGELNEDLDVVVEDGGEAFAERAASELGGSVRAHTRFGTAILVLPDSRKIDVATSRGEAYERPGALPTVRTGGIEEDLKRRDFTINSMAVRLGTASFGELVDLYGGEDDLRGRTLRVLTDQSFIDDPTRVLRGIRFAARLGFGFEGRTEKLLKEAVTGDNLSTVSGERIMNEIVLMLRERRPWPPVASLIDWGVLRAIDERWSLDGAVRERLERTFAGLAEALFGGPAPVEEEDGWRLHFLALMEPLRREDRTAVLERLRAGRRLRELARSLATFEEAGLSVLTSERDLKRSEIHAAAAGAAPEALVLESIVLRGGRAAERIRLYLSELRNVAVSLDGDGLASLGVGQGREVGIILDALLRARLDGEIKTDEEEAALAANLAKNLDARNKSC